jgi:G6PDH family F420-dependent oxidoreductase
VAARDTIDYGLAAEEVGFDRLLMADHFRPWMDLQGHAPQAWVALGALGRRTRHVTLGTSVTSPIYRYRPTVVAQAFATLAALYPGRVFLGLGPGDDRAAVGPAGDWGAVRERADRLVEAVAIIRRLWQGDSVTHHGRHFHISDVRLYDLPAQPVPLYIAAEGVESMRLAGRHGDGLITGAGAALRPELRSAFAEGAREAGKDPADMPVLAELFVVVGRGAPQPPAATALSGQWVISVDPEEHADAIRRLFAAGVSEVYINAAQPDQRRALEFYGREVLPRVRGLQARAWGA